MYPRNASRASGGIGRRARFRSVCPKGRGGSTPPSRTKRCPRKWAPDVHEFVGKKTGPPGFRRAFSLFSTRASTRPAPERERMGVGQRRGRPECGRVSREPGRHGPLVRSQQRASMRAAATFMATLDERVIERLRALAPDRDQ